MNRPERVTCIFDLTIKSLVRTPTHLINGYKNSAPHLVHRGTAAPPTVAGIYGPGHWPIVFAPAPQVQSGSRSDAYRLPSDAEAAKSEGTASDKQSHRQRSKGRGWYQQRQLFHSPVQACVRCSTIAIPGFVVSYFRAGSSI